jgi:hypothetical protein
MAINNRQTNLFAVEDWKKLYTTFSEADFQSYDFETIRKVMVDYLRTYYAEDYNDFIESSEFIALIDLIAFQAQSLAFRTDLNARENFLETAERKDSVLKLVKQLNYNPNRNKAANGLLKIVNITTSESVFDYSSNNLSRANIIWNDPSNPDWASQFSLVVNAALSSGQRIGKPFASKTINGVITEQYNIAVPTSVAQVVFPFTSQVNSITTPFEVVSASITNSDSITEQDPGTNGSYGIIFQNDGRGNASGNTGYFMYFKQGTLNTIDFSFADKIPNRVVNIAVENINNEDVWFYDITNSATATQWTKIANISGSNAIYNSTARGIRKLFSVNTRANDQIDLVFGDDTFADTPMGNYRTFYRISNGLTYRISPADLKNVTIVVPYISKSGKPERLTITGSLQYTVANSSRRDLIQEIKDKAPQNFYTQGRMVNGEDYNTLPYTTYADIVKVKSVNRYSSGISRYLDIIDPTGKYSSTDLFGSDGSFFKNETIKNTTFTFSSRNDVLRIIENTIQPAIANKSAEHFYFQKFPAITIPNLFWVRQTDDTSTATGFFRQVNGSTYEKIGNFTSQAWKYLLVDSLIKFESPYGYYFDSSNSLVAGTPVLSGDKTVIWATIQSQIGDGSNPIYLAGREVGGVTISTNIPSGALVTQCYAPYTINFTSSVINTMATYILNNQNFALRYDYTSTLTGDPWKLVAYQNLDVTSPFSLQYAGTGGAKDSSWIILFTTDNVKYNMKYRGLDYIFSSTNSIRFLNTNPTPVYDSRTNTLIRDNIKVLQSNLNNSNTAKLERDVTLQIYQNQVETDGYTDSTKVLVTFPTGPNSDLPLDPNIFGTIVGNTDRTYVFYQRYLDYDNLIRYQLLDSGIINYVYPTKVSIDNVRNNFPNGRLFYATADHKFYQVVNNGIANTLTDVSADYAAYYGRQDLIFQYRHNASDSRRIDPAASNLIDCYILTRSYDESYRQYITDYTGRLTEPMVVDSVTLNSTYNQLLNLKMISDEMILNSGVYKPLFGTKADDALQATFQIVKNPSTSLSDNELKSRVVEQINNYFTLDNWDFGQTFYFSELSAFLHTKLGTYLSSVILIPTSPNSVFGNLYEIRSQPNEILINAATVDNIQVVSGVYVGINQSGVSTVYASQINGIGV